MSYLEELLPEFRKGAKIRQKRWKDGAYIERRAQGIIYRNIEAHEVDILADDYELYQEIIDWDYIIKNKCLCWFWSRGFRDSINYASFLEGRDEYGRFETEGGFPWTYCYPVRRDEVTFYEDRKDER